MNMFIQDFPQSLQLLSFPCEGLGLLLICVELFRPRRADAIEHWINALPRRARQVDHRFEDRYVLPIVTAVLFFSVMLPLLLTIGNRGALDALAHWLDGHSPLFNTVVFVLLGGVLALPVGVALSLSGVASRLIALLNRLSNGRALGAFGLIVSIVGMTGEFFQMFVGTTGTYWANGSLVLVALAIGFARLVIREPPEEAPVDLETRIEQFDWDAPPSASSSGPSRTER